MKNSPQAPKTVRIVDIAQTVGVSVSLVSKVLNDRMGKSTVRPELAERIRACARDLGYVPNASARALFFGRSNAIGVFVLCHDLPFRHLHEMFIEGVTKALAQGERHLVFHFLHDEASLQRGLMLARQKRVDGIIASGDPNVDADNLFGRLMDTGVPLVSTMDVPVAETISNVGLSQEKVGAVAAAHLLERGCRKPAFAYVPSVAGDLRLNGFKQVLAEAGRPCRPEQIVTVADFDEPRNAVAEAMVALAAQGIDGVVARTDPDAMAIENHLLMAGVRIPQDFRIVGIGDTDICRHAILPISSVSAHDDERSRLGVELLDAVIRGEAPRHLKVEPEVIRRETT